MAQNREEFEYDLDASGLIAEYERIADVIRKVNNLSEEEAAIIGKVEDILNLSYEAKRKLIKQEEALAYARQFSIEKMQEEYVLMRKLQEEYEASAQMMAELNRAREKAQTDSVRRNQQSTMDDATEAERNRLALLEDEAALTRELSAAQTNLNRTRQQEVMDNAVSAEKERISNLEAQAALTRELSAAYTESVQNKQKQTFETLKEAAAERELEQNRRRAAAAARMISTTIPVQSGTGANQLGRIQELIMRGEVSARRVVQIANEVANGLNIAYTGAERTVANAARAMVRENERIATAAQRAADRSNRATHTMFLSWQSLARLLVIQNIHLGVYKIINAMNESIAAASQFQIKISEIRTISQDTSLSFKEWSTTARQLSDAFGAPINDVASGLYETISNQIAKGAEAATFMAKAMAFARTTVASTEEAVNLLSSALNSYGLKVQDTDRVSAILFKTIDLGRVRASEMANTFGRVAGLAAPLGVSLEEVSAAIATLTINGVKYNEAYTLINNILLKLLRPTKEMKQTLQDWGFSSGEAAIQGLGFVGVLQKLENESRTSADDVGELFNQIRGIRGVLGLTGSAFKTFTRDLAQIQNASSEYQAAQAIAAESAGKKFEIEMNKIKNFFISDFGEPFIRGVIWLTESTDKASGSVSTLADKFRMIAIWTPKVIQGFLVYKAAVATANSGLLTFVRTQGLAQAASYGFGRSLEFVKANLAQIGTGAAIAGVFYIIGKMEEAESKLRNLEETTTTIVAAALDKQTADYRKKIDEQTDNLKRGFNERFKATFEYGAKVRQLFTKQAADQAKLAKEAADASRNAFDILEQAARKAITQVEQLSNKALENAKRAREIIESELPDRNRFEKQLDLLPEDQQIQARIQKIASLRSQLRTLVTGAKNKSPEESAKDLADAAKIEKEIQAQITALIDKRGDAMKKIKEIQDQLDESNAREASRDQVNEVNARIRELEAKKSKSSAELKELKALQISLRQAEAARRSDDQQAKLQGELDLWKGVLAALGNEGTEQQRINDFAKERNTLFKEYADAQDALAKKLQAQAEAEQKRFELLKDIAKEASAFKLDLTQGTTSADFEKSSNQQLAEFDKLISRAIQSGASKESIDAMQKQAAELAKQSATELDKRKFDETTNRLAKEKETALKNLDDIANRQKDFDEQKKRSMIQLQTEVEKIIESTKTGWSGFWANIVPGANMSEIFKARLGGSLKLINETLNADNTTPKQKEDALRRQISVLRRETTKAAYNVAGADKTVTQGDLMGQGEVRINDILNRIYAIGQEIIHTPEKATELQKLLDAQQKALKELGVQEQKLKQEAAGKGVSLEQEYNATLQTTTSNLKSFEEAIISVGKRLQSLNPGQQISFNTSNLTPTSQIRVPSISKSGGVNVGDIHVTVNSSGNAQTDGKAIATALKREIRMGGLDLETV